MKLPLAAPRRKNHPTGSRGENREMLRENGPRFSRCGEPVRSPPRDECHMLSRAGAAKNHKRAEEMAAFLRHRLRKGCAPPAILRPSTPQVRRLGGGDNGEILERNEPRDEIRAANLLTLTSIAQVAPSEGGQQIATAPNPLPCFAVSTSCRQMVGGTCYGGDGSRPPLRALRAAASRGVVVLAIDNHSWQYREIQNAAARSPRIIERNMPVAATESFLSFRRRAATPQNSHGRRDGRSRLFAERNAREIFFEALPGGSKSPSRRTAARQNHPPLGEKQHNPSRKPTPRLKRAAPKCEISFSRATPQNSPARGRGGAGFGELPGVAMGLDLAGCDGQFAANV